MPSLSGNATLKFKSRYSVVRVVAVSVVGVAGVAVGLRFFAGEVVATGFSLLML